MAAKLLKTEDVLCDFLRSQGTSEELMLPKQIKSDEKKPESLIPYLLK